LLIFCAGLAAGSQPSRADDAPKKRQNKPAAAPAAQSGKPANPPANATKTLRETAQELGQRHGVRIVIDNSVRADVPAPVVADGILKGALLEATLRALFTGNELMFHYGAGDAGGAERLKAVWVFSRALAPVLRATAAPAPINASPDVDSYDPEERAAALHRLASEPPSSAQPILSRALSDSDENVRLQALNAELTNASTPDAQELRRLVEEDPSEAVRTLALQAFVANPGVSDEEALNLLDRVAGGSQPMLAELARSLREARTSMPSDFSLEPDPIDQR
jgi:hypothetical protein